MAARLMMKFPNAVTCDETTKIKSKLPEEDFVEQPPVVLKGIADPGTIFTYSTEKYVSSVCYILYPTSVRICSVFVCVCVCVVCVCVCLYVSVCVCVCVCTYTHVRLYNTHMSA